MNPYGPTIETLEDWNDTLGECGCCGMPECPVPDQECESITITLCGYSLPQCPGVSSADLCRRFAKATHSLSQATEEVIGYNGSERRFQTFSAETVTIRMVDQETCDESVVSYNRDTLNFERIEEEVYNEETEEYEWQFVVNVTTTFHSQWPSGGAGCTGTYSVIFDPEGNGNTSVIDEEDNNPNCSFLDYFVDCDWDVDPTNSWRFFVTGPSESIVGTETKAVVYSEELDVSGRIEEMDFDSGGLGYLCMSEYGCGSATKHRFRWAIPDGFTGIYFKITWDVVEEPVGWEADPPTASRSFFATDQTWEWTGPGDPEDPDSWKSGWYEIPPPPSPGSRKVVNIRYECYRNSPYGNKPQVSGESADPAGGQHDGSDSLQSFTQPLR